MSLPIASPSYADASDPFVGRRRLMDLMPSYGRCRPGEVSEGNLKILFFPSEAGGNIREKGGTVRDPRLIYTSTRAITEALSLTLPRNSLSFGRSNFCERLAKWVARNRKTDDDQPMIV